MNVLALTHAHLMYDGLSPVSCERADSFVGNWAEKLHWNVDVIYTKNTKWRGIWPDGKGLQVNIVAEEAPKELMITSAGLFSANLKLLIKKKQFGGAISLAANRVAHRVRMALAARGLALTDNLLKAKTWGGRLAISPAIKNKKYDFIFVCVGYGDEYLLETALVLSVHLKTPMIVDFRDLWSGHHEPARFTTQQRKIIKKLELRLLKNTILLSVPQKPMAAHLQTYLKIPVHITPHSAHVELDWQDGHVVSDEFRMLYAGKLYAGSPGLEMLLEVIQKISGKLAKPVKCHFFVDNVAAINKMVKDRNLENSIVAHEWVSPGAIWSEMRSAHLLITFDTGLFPNMPIMMTKVFQYAHTGRQVLALYLNQNATYEDFFNTYPCGAIAYTADDAATRVQQISNDERLYTALPALRKVVTREETAVAFGNYISEVISQK